MVENIRGVTRMKKTKSNKRTSNEEMRLEDVLKIISANRKKQNKPKKKRSK